LSAEYKVVRLSRPEGSVSWDEEGESYGRQISDAAQDRWELIDTHNWPWVIFRRWVVVEAASRSTQGYSRATEAGTIDEVAGT
jgi:hypothetical protein